MRCATRRRWRRRPTASRRRSTSRSWRPRWPPRARPRARERNSRSRITPAPRCTELRSAARTSATRKGRLSPALPCCVLTVASGALCRGVRLRGGLRRRRLPAAGLALVLLLQPFLQRGEVLQHRAAVDLLAAGQLLERGLPRLAGATRQHGAELRARLLVAMEAAFVQRPGVAGGLAQRLVELELQQVGEEVAGVRGVARHVVLGARIEELLAAGLHRGHALVLRLQFPPRLVVAVRGDRAVE